MFEQLGTFKKEFIKLGYEAYDYDIQNNFGQTDFQIDLFKEIENAYDGMESVFDNITKDDLIMAFFPCIYFSALSQIAFSFSCKNYRRMSQKEKTEEILKRSSNRELFFRTAVKMIVENPWSEQTFLKANFVQPPTIIDSNRQLRGDYFKKPTAYWFFNCEPTNGKSYQKPKETKIVQKSKQGKSAGICSEERSLISPDYARNFICDFIIGKVQNYTMIDMFK